MINYKLAKKLKDAGFPQKEYGNGLTDGGCPHWMGKGHGKCDCFAYNPTLSELIKECIVDKEEKCLYRLDYDWFEKQWTACAGTSNPSEHYETFGSTPEKAVSNLYLKLNNKQND